MIINRLMSVYVRITSNLPTYLSTSEVENAGDSVVPNFGKSELKNVQPPAARILVPLTP